MFKLVCIITLAIEGLAIAVHYLIFGPRRRELRNEPATVRRFGLVELLLHALTAMSFLLLAVTGGLSVLRGGPMEGWPRILHWVAAPFFALGLAGIALAWARDGRFEPGDKQWLRRVGGYLGGPDDLPAGRFNAGQKVFFWTVLLPGVLSIVSGLGRMFPLAGDGYQALCFNLHRYSSLALVLAVIGHLYLGTLANPGTLRAVILGKVGTRWARHHHPQWHKEVHHGEQDNHEQ